MDTTIEAEGLEKTYPGDVRALDGLSFAVEAGSIFGLLGPNGAGKSTAVKVLTTLARADGGEAPCADRPLAVDDVHAAAVGAVDAERAAGGVVHLVDGGLRRADRS